ncbi:D-alanyl-D-alanine carboxypeptidase [Candidatus Nucleicultrix amoebiphila]|jgi:D-alanyl-D-alanine carboxypeptidase|uniref:D-alanyl-D-alanine carboxypeptidase n=1 Tax=Candidatus Nucleicultrix amoebiphila TaxID=1509244 RepID=UPI000A27002F|nr:D-alanyl-D-alanine carboxypeptidase [Candidatus Nucleicultrix amoebiphila]
MALRLSLLNKLVFFFFLATSMGLLSSAAQAMRYAHIVIDAKTGRVFHAKSADTTVFPWSLTKMMTLYLLLEQLESRKVSLDTKIRISKSATTMPNFQFHLKPGTRVPVRYAILGLMVKSANDMAVAIAEHLGNGSEARFAQMMTQKARELGLSRTTFRNASGVPDPLQSTTAKDMAVLSQALYKRFPQYSSYFGTPSFQMNGLTYKNSNKLLGTVVGVNGIKTGYARGAHNLAVSAIRDNRHIIAVLIGGKSASWRDQRLASLVESTFEIINSEKKNGLKNQNELQYVVLAKNLNPPSSVSKQSEIMLANNNLSQPLSIPPEYFTKRLPTPSEINAPRHSPEIKQVSYSEPASPITTVNDKSGDWAIQIGAYRQSQEASNAANAVLKTMPKIMATKAKITISPSPRNKRKVYRARLNGFSKDQALNFCKKVTAKGGQCLPIKPSRSAKIFVAMK